MSPRSDPARMGDRLDRVLDFYAARGYACRVGPGAHPALLIIDWSRAFTESAGQFPGADFSAELAQTRRLLDAGRRGRAPVFFTTIAYAADMADAGLWVAKVPWLRHCLLGSPAVDIDPAVAPAPGERVVVKKFPSAFHGTGLDDDLRAVGIDTLVVAGCTTSVCVRATVVDALQHGYRTLVAAEAVGDFVPELHRLHLADLDARYADVTSVDELVSYLTRVPARKETP
jgi:nicotinamidase-related amidase